MPAKSRLLITSVLLLIIPALFSGCLSSRKKNREREKSIPTAVEQSLKERWSETRVAELVAGGFSHGDAHRLYRYGSYYCGLRRHYYYDVETVARVVLGKARCHRALLWEHKGHREILRGEAQGFAHQ